jgi:hypothetical protein
LHDVTLERLLAGVGAWAAPVLDPAVSELRQSRPGCAAVPDHVRESVFVDAARRGLEVLPDNALGLARCVARQSCRPRGLHRPATHATEVTRT